MKKLNLVMVSLLSIVIVLLPQTGSAGAFVLHPSGFGAHSYAVWREGEGIVMGDNMGTRDVALYFQKMTSTATFAAGVAVIKGFEGLPSTDIIGLKFWVRSDGHCGAGAPRYNVRVQTALGPLTTFFGCLGQTDPTGMIAAGPGGTLYVQRAVPVVLLPPGTIISIAIVFDEGTDQGVGFVHLDNIEVDSSSTGNHVWTQSSDNGGNPSSTANTAESLEELLGEPLSTLFPET